MCYILNIVANYRSSCLLYLLWSAHYLLLWLNKLAFFFFFFQLFFLQETSRSNFFLATSRFKRSRPPRHTEITSWLVSAYDFYSRVVKNRKRTSESSGSLKIQHLFKISRQWNEFYSLESVKTSTFSFQNFSKGKRGNFKASDI